MISQQNLTWKEPSTNLTDGNNKEHQPLGQQHPDHVRTLFKLTQTAPNAISTIAEGKYDSLASCLTLNVGHCDVVLVGQSNTVVQPQIASSHRYPDDQTESLGEDVDRDERSLRIVNNANESQQALVNDVEADSSRSFSCLLSRFVAERVDIPIPLIRIQGYLNGKQCERLMTRMERLQDDGKFDEHQCLVNWYLQLCEKKGNTDMAMLLLIQQGTASSYHKQFKTSKRLLNSVINFEEHSKLRNRNVLRAKAYYLLAANLADRGRKVWKFRTVFHCLTQSQKCLENHDSPEDWSALYYNYGSAWLAYLATIAEGRNEQVHRTVRKKARDSFERAIAVCKQDPRLRVQIKKESFCHLRLAALLLECFSTATRCRHNVIPPDDIKEAKQHLDFVEDQFATGVPFGVLVQLLKTRSDYFYRKGMYQLAQETAQEALKIGKQHGFNTELDTLQGRVDFLDSFWEKPFTRFSDEITTNSSSDASQETG